MGRVPRLLVVEVDGGFQLQRGKHFFRFVGLLLKKKNNQQRIPKQVNINNVAINNVTIVQSGTIHCKEANSIGTRSKTTHPLKF